MAGFDLNDEKIDRLLELAGKKIGMDKESLKGKIRSGEMEQMVREKSGMDAERVSQLLHSPGALEKLMQNPEIAKILGTIMRQEK